MGISFLSLYILWVHPEKSAHENYLVILFLLVHSFFIFQEQANLASPRPHGFMPECFVVLRWNCFFKHNFSVKPYVPREPRRDPSNRRLNEHWIYICQESNSRPVPSQAGVDTTKPPIVVCLSNGSSITHKRRSTIAQTRSESDRTARLRN